MFPRPPSLTVPPATGGEVTDAALEQVIDVAERAFVAHRPITDAEGMLLALNAPALLRELLQHRHKMAMIRDLAEPDNVLVFRGA